VLYFADQARAEEFYSGVLGLRLIDREPGRSLFYRAGSNMLLLFHAETTALGGTLPSHGAAGPIHTCFRVERERYEAWKSYLGQRGVTLVDERSWPRGRSFFFRDPDGNLLEIADADIWPG
jgi:catechol 2,3-dioxygenase-like lactoylglutathione lyase family enzyme